MLKTEIMLAAAVLKMNFTSLVVEGMVNVTRRSVNGDTAPYITLTDNGLTIGVNGVELVIPLSDILKMDVENWGSEDQFTGICFQTALITITYTVTSMQVAGWAVQERAKLW